ncbi:hypothetical protein F2P79_012778 [Pimephales promelas]|nr:hypothetical protein F2P79_012778 [Pimephales promelas]
MKGSKRSTLRSCKPQKGRKEFVTVHERERGRDIQQAYIHYQDDLLFKGPKTLFTFRARRRREGRGGY